MHDNKQRYISVSDIQKEYLPISKKKIRVLIKKYLPTKMIGNRIFVEREQFERLLTASETLKLDLA